MCVKRCGAAKDVIIVILKLSCVAVVFFNILCSRIFFLQKIVIGK